MNENHQVPSLSLSLPWIKTSVDLSLSLTPFHPTLATPAGGGGQGGHAAGGRARRRVRRPRRRGRAPASARERACERARACGGRAAVVRDGGGWGFRGGARGGVGKVRGLDSDFFEQDWEKQNLIGGKILKISLD